MAVERKGFSDRRRAGAVGALPEAVAEHGDGRAAADVVRGLQQAAGGGREAEAAEEAAAHPGAGNPPRLAARREVEHRLAAAGTGEGAGEEVFAVAQLLPDRVGEDVVVVHRDLHQLFRMSDRERAQHHGVDQAEDRRVGADAEGEREDGDQREAGAPAQHARRVAQIGDQRLEPDEDVGVAHPLLLQRSVAEAAPRLAQGLRPAQAARHQLVGALGEMERHLAVEVPRQPLGPHQIDQLLVPGHGRNPPDRAFGTQA